MLGCLAVADLVGVRKGTHEHSFGISQSFLLEEVVLSVLELVTLTIVDKNLTLIEDLHFRELCLGVENSHKDRPDANYTEETNDPVVLSHVICCLAVPVKHGLSRFLLLGEYRLTILVNLRCLLFFLHLVCSSCSLSHILIFNAFKIDK